MVILSPLPQERVDLIDEDDKHFLARLKSPATSLFDPPYHLFVSTDAAMLINVAPDSLARALASIVLPQPGGPYRRTPFGAPMREDEVKRFG